MPGAPHIAILMATWNGAAFLREQLESIAAQTHENWSLRVSDDGSTDATCHLVREFAARQPHRRIELLQGPQQGPTQNFLSLLAQVSRSADFVAFSDQDDVWLPDKLARAVAEIAQDAPRPALYGARTIVTDKALNRRGLSPLFPRAPGFANALVQSLAGGNTMLMNRAATDLCRRAGAGIDPVTHDWWVYQLVSGAGGAVRYDPEPFLLYRQHPGNLIGSNAGYRASLIRLRAVMQNRFRDWNDRNLRTLESCAEYLTPENRALLREFAALRRLSGLHAVSALRRAGLYRQTRKGNASLYLAAALGKI